MLLRSFDLLLENPGAFVTVFSTFLATVGVALLVAITVHEFSHAAIAYSLGDLTAKRLGRLSLNPIRHLDPVGTVMLMLVGFGWGKPVPVNPYNLRNGGRRGMSIVSAAGPMANLVTAAIFALPIRIGLISWHSPFTFRGLQDQEPVSLFADLLGFVIFFNIILAIFNLIPLFPLDGSKVAIGVLPRGLANTFARWEASGPAILLGIIMVDWFTDLNLLWGVLRPLVDMVGFIVLGHRL
ncbi:MAG: site-2 protease family protein [Dehalococcoidia bacterium]|jgi:Zn-dependent protease|nr:site-2 protease family protein [Dehalococcoidia bacterium]